ncbi:peptidase inhibitor family I36 protein [Micromonospora sp. NPDC093244]|uniref:peptidase inhibitor family I36 protein n=1 Tax=Micromonospora sp. NPDC093244 TaxID=3155071 RepID=UPI003432C6AC
MVASPAQAAKSECTSTGWLCEWGSANYSGTFAYWDPSGSLTTECRKIGSYYPRSAYNRAIGTYRYYSASNCTGSSVTVASYGSAPNFGFAAHSFRFLTL